MNAINWNAVIQTLVLIRIGQVPALEDLPPPTPRRPLADVLAIR